MPTWNEVREARIRRMADRASLAMQKSRTRDRTSPIFGTFALFDMVQGARVPYERPGGYGLTLDDVEIALVSDVLEVRRADEGGGESDRVVPILEEGSWPTPRGRARWRLRERTGAERVDYLYDSDLEYSEVWSVDLAIDDAQSTLLWWRRADLLARLEEFVNEAPIR